MLCSGADFCSVIVNITFAAETRKRDLGERLRPTSERLMHLVGELPVVDATVFLGKSGSQFFCCFISSSVLIAREVRRKKQWYAFHAIWGLCWYNF